jgi:hypothetical protein
MGAVFAWLSAWVLMALSINCLFVTGMCINLLCGVIVANLQSPLAQHHLALCLRIFHADTCAAAVLMLTVASAVHSKL